MITIFKRVLAVSGLLLIAIQPIHAQWVKVSSIGNDGASLVFANRLYMSGYHSEMEWTTDEGETWHDAYNGLPYDDAAISMASIGSTLIMGTTYDLMFFSTDSGGSWHQSDWHYMTASMIRSLVVHDGYVFAGGDGLFRSSDSGRNWEWDTTGFPPFLDREIFSFASSDSVLFAGATSYYIKRSTNDGKSWDTVQITHDYSGGDVVQSLAAIGHIVLAGTTRGLYRSTDLGLTWSHIDTSLIAEVSSFLTINGDVIMGTWGPLKSTDSGITWESFDQGITPENQIVYLMKDKNYLFASQDADGSVWRRPLSDLAGVKQAEAVPPDSPELSFYNSRLSITSSSPIHSVAIIDVMGRTLSKVESHEATVVMDLHDLANGLYFVRIKMDEGISVRKIVLEKRGEEK